MTASGAAPLLLVPGTLCDAVLWQAQMPALAAKREVHVVDWRSERDIAALAARILVEAPERFAIAGMSMGGSIALEVCAQGAARVTGLALVDAQPGVDLSGRREARQAQLAYAGEHGLAALIRDKLWPLYVHADRLADERLMQIIQGMAQRCGCEQFARHSDLLATRKDRMHVLSMLAVPVLLLAGEHDVLCPDALQIAMAQRLADGHYERIPGCGHFAVLEAPERVEALLLDWLRRCA